MRELIEGDVREYFDEAIKIAKEATCSRSKCGSVIVKDDEIIGRGFNSPPADMESQKRCPNDKSEYNLKVTDKTCCVHAEQRAILDAIKRNPNKTAGSTLYFIRLKDEKPVASGDPYCTLCSKLALDTGIKEFVLYHGNKIIAYGTEEYNDLSFSYAN